MKVVLQRVSHASVTIDGKVFGRIDSGFLLLVGIGPEDTEEVLGKMAKKILALRVFEDGEGKMNRSIQDLGGEILSISQFTLYGDTRKGNRPSFTGAAKPEDARRLYEQFNEILDSMGGRVQTGIFGADMKVELLNDGPVTILLEMGEEDSRARGPGSQANQAGA